MSKLHKQFVRIKQAESRAQNGYGYGKNFVIAVKEIRYRKNLGLRETLDFMMQEFGFEVWNGMSQDWLREKQLDFSSVTGPHAVTILKAMAAKHGIKDE